MTPRTQSLLAGALGGIAGTFAMATCNALWSRVDDRGGPRARARRLERAGVGRGQFAQSEPRSHEDDDTPSQALARRVPGVRAPGTERVVGSLIHFAFGAAAGTAYALAIDAASPKWARALTAGRGVAYGSLVWLIADEIAIPLSGLAPPPHASPPRLHAYSLAGHFAYGLVLEQTRRGVSRRFTGGPESLFSARRAKKPAQPAAGPRVRTRN